MITLDPQSVEKLKASLAAGRSQEDIYKDLLAQGWTIEAIQESFNALDAERGAEDTSKKTVRTIVTIAAVLIGAGIFSFIAANWPGMPRPVRVVIILLSMATAYGSGWYLKEKSDLAKTAEALFLLGSILYGAGIFLVAQMFHIRADWPDGFILWMIGVIAMAFAVESYALFALALPLGALAVFGHPFTLFTGFGNSSFLLTSSLLLLAATIITFATGWVIRKRLPPELKEFY